MGKHANLLKSEDKFRYMMLSRMQQDCDYYLGYGNRSKNALWAQDEQDQIDTMKELWNSFAEGEKPEWLTWDDILNYEKQMIAQNSNPVTMEDGNTVEYLNLSDNEIEEIRSLQNSMKCTWEVAYEIWNEDTTRYENGE